MTPGCTLPGYVPTPNTFITCSLAATTQAFNVSMASAAAPGFFCFYNSAQTPSLFCS